MKKESMRMATGVAFSGTMELPQDETVCGYRLPKGSMLTVLNRTNHMSKSTWGNPNEFSSERWLADNSSDLAKNISTFSNGLRSCIGMKLAMTEILTMMVFLVSRYKFKFINDEKKTLDELLNETYTTASVNHEKGLFFEYEKREFT